MKENKSKNSVKTKGSGQRFEHVLGQRFQIKFFKSYLSIKIVPSAFRRIVVMASSLRVGTFELRPSLFFRLICKNPAMSAQMKEGQCSSFSVAVTARRMKWGQVQRHSQEIRQESET